MNTKKREPERAAWAAIGVTAAICALLAVSMTLAMISAGVAAILPFALILAVFLAVGGLLATRMPRHPLGWLLMAIPGLFALQIPFQLLGISVRDSAPDLAAWLLWYGGDREDTWTWVLPVGLLFTQIPLRFPDGRLPSFAWRWFSWFTILTIVLGGVVVSTSPAKVGPDLANPVYIPAVRESPWLFVVFATLLAASFIGSIASLFVRYRRADGVVRAQLRWVLWGVAIPVAALIFSWVVITDWELVNQLVLLTYGFIPIAIAVAVLRYRLYDIDRIISRTAAYGTVTVLVLGVYAVIVTSVTWLLPKAPAVAVALATLAAAALFLPALRWIRRRVDRRFDRARYDAERVVEQFGERLRTGADPHTASADLTDAIALTLQPASMGLWVQEGRS